MRTYSPKTCWRRCWRWTNGMHAMEAGLLLFLMVLVLLLIVLIGVGIARGPDKKAVSTPLEILHAITQQRI